MFHTVHSLPSSVDWSVVAAIGELLWFPVYFIVIYQNWKQKVCGMPLLGICAIFVQCTIYATFGPYLRPDLFPHNPVIGGTFAVVWVWRVWLVVQGTVLYQFFLYHDHARYPLELPVSMTGLKRTVGLLLVANLVVQWSFITFYHDYNVNQSDPLFYLFMASGYVMLARVRPQLEGLSLGVAWMKMIGTALIFLTIFVDPVKSFGSLSILESGRPELAQSRACAVPPGETCPAFRAPCDMMDEICPGWSDTSKPLTNCEPTAKTVLSAASRLEKDGWKITGPDSVYKSQFGEFDLIHDSGPGPATWCPVTTRWDVVDIVDNTIRFHYQFPLAMCVAGVSFDCAYIYMVWKRRRKMRADAAAAAAATNTRT